MAAITTFFLAIAVAMSTGMQVQARPDFSGTWVLVPDIDKSELIVTNPGQPRPIMGPARVPSLGNSFTLKQTAEEVLIQRPFNAKVVVTRASLLGKEITSDELGEQTIWRGRWDGQKLVLLTRLATEPAGSPNEVKRVIWFSEDGNIQIETTGLANRPVQISTYKRQLN